MVPKSSNNLTFSGGVFTPRLGLDERIVEIVRQPVLNIPSFKRATSATYGFILLDEYLSKDIEEKLRALGITLLGPHDDAYKVKLPLNIEALNAAVALPYVKWLSYSLPEQKLSLDLQQTIARSVSQEGKPPVVAELPVVINLFDDDIEGGTSPNA